MSRYRVKTRRDGTGELQARTLGFFWRTLALGIPAKLSSYADRLNQTHS